MPLLTATQYLSAFGESRRQVVGDEGPSFDYWPYFDAIPAWDFEGHDCSAGLVRIVYRMIPGPFEHVLVDSEVDNVFMVIILDREAGVVFGHRLLDLNRE